MAEVTTTSRTGDARDEKFQRMGSTLARFGPSPTVPSPNLAKVFAALESGELAPIAKLAEDIFDGRATGSEEEQAEVYDAVPLLLDYVRDLADMCRRREQALAELDISIGR